MFVFKVTQITRFSRHCLILGVFLRKKLQHNGGITHRVPFLISGKMKKNRPKAGASGRWVFRICVLLVAGYCAICWAVLRIFSSPGRGVVCKYCAAAVLAAAALPDK